MTDTGYMEATKIPTTDRGYDEIAAAYPTYEALAAAFRAGEVTSMEMARGRRNFNVHTAAGAMRRANERARRYATKVQTFKADQYRYTDAWCLERLTCEAPGLEREAALLLKLTTPAQRREAVRMAHRFTNATADAGRWSDAVQSCLADARRAYPDPADEARTVRALTTAAMLIGGRGRRVALQVAS